MRAAVSPKERAFVEAFYTDPNMSIAAAVTAAGFGISPKGASAFGENLLHKPTVQRLIGQMFASARDRTQDIRDGTVQALWLLATGWDIKDLVGDVPTPDEDDEGKVAFERGLLAPDQLPAALRAAIKEVSFVKGRWAYKLVDKSAILAQLLKHFADQDKRNASAEPPPAEPTEPSVVVWREDE